ncbi:MAG: WS/DGAT domain-containing protein [Rhodococcus fascians]
MTVRLHPTDAQTYWMSAKIPNDQFLLYCFDTDSPAESVREELLRRAEQISDLGMRIVDFPLSLRYPSLRRAPDTTDLVHIRETGRTWRDCLDTVAEAFTDQLDPHRSVWRLHLVGGVTGAPRCDGPALVAILQISHAFGDGRVASSLARRLFGDDRSAPAPIADRTRIGPREFFRRATRAYDLERQLAADTAAGTVPASAPGRPRIRVNVAPAGRTSVRCLVRDRSDFTAPGISVTVGAATAISLALERYLAHHGDPVPPELGAEATLGKHGERRARNHFGNAGVDLRPDITDLAARAHAISESLQARRRRAAHPAAEAQSLASEAVPAVLLHWGVRQFDATAVPDTVTGNTVLSSVARGAADLEVGGGPVRFTAGFPALSPIMGLTHGVHGIGDAVTVSVTSAASAMPDPDVYCSFLDRAIDEVSTALRRSCAR